VATASLAVKATISQEVNPMAWLEKRGDSFHLSFRLGNQKFKKSLKTDNQTEAETALARAERRLKLIEDGDLPVPDDADLLTFILSDGKLERPLVFHAMTLRELLVKYESSLRDGSLETNSIATIKLHLKHVARILGSNLRADRLTFRDLQNYVDVRSPEKGRRGRSISAVTVKKELASLSGVWNWAARMGHVRGSFPSKGLSFQKTTEKPKFQTRIEIERQIAKAKLSGSQQAELWSCLYLSEQDIEDLLQVVEEKALHDFIYPMVLMAARTGARRSEIVRSLCQDFDLEGGFVQLHEKKRVRGRTTTRAVPLSSRLKRVMSAWLAGRTHNKTFTNGINLLTVKDATHHLNWTLKGTKWECIPGWHVFSHSFISIFASKGIDQRMIDDWTGHQTEEMRKRYRHLLPNVQRTALHSVFGS
jgi:integrase